MPPTRYRYAADTDTARVAALIELAYRGPAAAKSWTNEAHLLTGPRTGDAEIAGLIADRYSRFVVAERGEELLGCALIQKDGADAYFGMFAVDPGQQGSGVGRELLAKSEKAARDLWASRTMTMVVINLRDELIAWYERRGYFRTGKTEPFPFHEHSGAMRQDFELVELQKVLTP